MGFLLRKKNVDGEQVDPLSLLIKAQKGDEEAREFLLESYKPFILKVAAKMSGRYIREGEDDEVSIGLLAFNEAINSFNTDKKVSFLSFAETVIKRRLIDYYRKEAPHRQTIPLSNFEFDQDTTEENALFFIEAKQSLEEYRINTEAEERREEILLYSKQLQDYGLTFKELVEISPRHEDARVRAIEVAKLIVSKEEFKNYLEERKELPLKQLAREVQISRKTLERQRKYIIAIALIMLNNYTHLKEYVQKTQERRENYGPGESSCTGA